ncbi:glycosyltransferase family 4 protein [Candidatus Woesearchaeota archaeon]|nr:glycosyltransferase family 4 protein [Candidatus Woesearchaeota archaeon]
MKILFITEYFPSSSKLNIRGGIEARIYLIAKELAKKHNISIICSREKNTKSFEEIDKINIFRVGSPRDYIQSGSVFSRMEFMISAFIEGRKIDFDIVEGQNFFSYLPAYMLSKVKRKPGISMYADTIKNNWLKYLGFFDGLVMEIFERILFLFKNKYFITISNHVKNKLIKSRINKEKIKVVYCGIDLKKYKFKDKKYPQKTICCVARLAKHKRIDDLLKAIKILKKHYPEIRCRLIGTGPEKSKLEKVVNELKIKKNVKFLGFLKNHKEVIREIKKSHLVCLPSLTEGFGIITIEAMACNVPYVNSDIPATREITKAGQGGLLFKPGDYRDLAEKIIYLLSNKKIYAEKAKQGKEFVQKYDIKNIADELERIYLNLVEK